METHSTEVARSAGGVSGRANILIVEDDAYLAGALARILKGQGYAAHIVPDGETAVEVVGERTFDLVILDIGLPGMDGFEVLRRLRGDGMRAPVLFLTARDAVSDRIGGLDLGADGYMVKPFAMVELVARVRALIRRSEAHSGLRIVYGSLTLDVQSRRAFLAGKPLELSDARCLSD